MSLDIPTLILFYFRNFARASSGALWRISPFLTFIFMSNFLPEGYEPPKSVSFYTKFEDGEKVKLRILESGLEDRNCIT